jgi:hypothetical protein
LPAPDKMHEKESFKLWSKMSVAIRNRRLDEAREIKLANEEQQRIEENSRKEKGEDFIPQFFVRKNGAWEFLWHDLFAVKYHEFCNHIEQAVKS